MSHEHSDKYSKLMAKYKELRLDRPEEAQKYLELAMKLSAEGGVDPDVVIGMAYV